MWGSKYIMKVSKGRDDKQLRMNDKQKQEIINSLK